MASSTPNKEKQKKEKKKEEKASDGDHEVNPSDKDKAKKSTKRKHESKAPSKAVINKRMALWRKQTPANIEWYCTELFEYDEFDPEDLEAAIKWLAENKPIEISDDNLLPSADGPVTPAKKAAMDEKEDEETKMRSKDTWSCCAMTFFKDDLCCSSCGAKPFMPNFGDQFCTKCNFKRPDGAKWCSKCSTRFSSSKEVADTSEGKEGWLSALQKIVAETSDSGGGISATAGESDKVKQVKSWNLVDMTGFILASGDARSRYVHHQLRPNRRFTLTKFISIEQFTAAWAVIIKMATQHASDHVPELTDHLLRIGALARKHEHNWQSVAEYDVAVRTKKAEDPVHVSLSVLDMDSWALAYERPGQGHSSGINTLGTGFTGSSYSGRRATSSRGTNEREICRSFNNSPHSACKFGGRCNFAHVCTACGASDHGLQSRRCLPASFSAAPEGSNQPMKGEKTK